MKKIPNKFQIPNTERNNKVIILRDIHNMSFNEIGKEMEITGERARQIYNKYKITAKIPK